MQQGMRAVHCRKEMPINGCKMFKNGCTSVKREEGTVH